MPLPAEQRPANFLTDIDSVFQAMPLEGDMTENETLLKFAVKLYQYDQAITLKYMDNITKTCIKVLIDDKCADDMKPEFKKEVGQFIKSVCSQHSAAYL